VMIVPGVDTLAPEADIVYSLVTCSPLSECAVPHALFSS
jgi:hypothetical protein